MRSAVCPLRVRSPTGVVGTDRCSSFAARRTANAQVIECPTPDIPVRSVIVDHRTLDSLASELRAALRELGLDASVEPEEARAGKRGLVTLEVDGVRRQVHVATRSDLRPLRAGELEELAAREA